MKDERHPVMEHLKAREEVYVTIKGEIDVSKQQLSDFGKEREKTLADLCHFFSEQQMKTDDTLATFVTFGLIRLAKKVSAWKKVKLFF